MLLSHLESRDTGLNCQREKNKSMNIRIPSFEKPKERITEAFSGGKIKIFSDLFSVIRGLETIGDVRAGDVILDIRKYLRREDKKKLSELPDGEGLSRVIVSLINKLLDEMGVAQDQKLPQKILEILGIEGDWVVEVIDINSAKVNVYTYVDALTGKKAGTADTVAKKSRTITLAQIFNLE